jgi:hypothetical protein
MGAVCSIPVFIKVDTKPTRVDLNPVRAKDLSAPLLSISLYPSFIFLILFLHSVLFVSEVIRKSLKHKTSEI